MQPRFIFAITFFVGSAVFAQTQPATSGTTPPSNVATSASASTQQAQVIPSDGEVVPLSEAGKPDIPKPNGAIPIPAITPDNSALLGRNSKTDEEGKRKKAPDFEIKLLSCIDSECHATLLVKGVAQRVKVGSHVLKHTVMEIREDGLCLLLDGQKGKCTFIDFGTGVGSD